MRELRYTRTFVTQQHATESAAIREYATYLARLERRADLYTGTLAMSVSYHDEDDTYTVTATIELVPLNPPKNTVVA